jgi:hypothetical protein
MPRTPVEAPRPTQTAEQAADARRSRRSAVLVQVREEVFAWVKTLTSAAVYATLIVTFGFQVARVEGQSMAPTLHDQDRLIVNKLAYLLDAPQVGDVVMLIYPVSPDKSFVKRIVAEPFSCAASLFRRRPRAGVKFRHRHPAGGRIVIHNDAEYARRAVAVDCNRHACIGQDHGISAVRAARIASTSKPAAPSSAKIGQRFL